jgi:transposase
VARPPDVNHELRQRLTARFNPIIKTFYERLHATGKPAKVARCAAVCKLLLLISAVVAKQRPFAPNYQQLAHAHR